MPLKHNTYEKTPPADSRTVRRLIGGVVLLAVLLNLAGVFLFRDFNYNASYWLIRYKWRMLETSPVLDWLILGDSSANQDVNTQLFSQVMGSSYNFGLFGDALLQGDLEMLRAYLLRHGAPRGVLMVHTDDIWSRIADPRVVAHTPVPMSRLPEYMVGTPSPAAFKAAYALERWMPLYSQPTSFRGLMTKPRQLRSPRRPIDEYGFQAVTTRHDSVVALDLKLRMAQADSFSFSVSEVNRRALHSICRLAEEYRFDVYFSLCPVLDQALQYPAFRERYDQLVEFLRSQAARSSRFHLLEPFYLTETADRMQNMDHLTAAAADDFTRLVISRIQNYRPPAVEAGLSE